MGSLFLTVVFKKKPLGNIGFKWLKIHLCNLFGANKISLQDRATFADENMENIRDSVERPLKGNRWWLTAENPFQALATCNEIINAIDSGDIENFESSLPVHQVFIHSYIHTYIHILIHMLMHILIYTHIYTDAGWIM